MRRAVLVVAALALVGAGLTLWHGRTTCQTWEDGSQSCTDGTVTHVPW